MQLYLALEAQMSGMGALRDCARARSLPVGGMLDTFPYLGSVLRLAQIGLTLPLRLCFAW